VATSAQTGVGNNQKMLRLRFIDRSTGYAIVPNTVSVSVTDDLSTNVVGKPIPQDKWTDLVYVLALSPGSYTVQALCKGYNPALDMKVQVGREISSAPLEVVLQPIELPAELQSSFVKSLHRPDATVILGFVADDEIRKPLRDVQVTSIPGAELVKTNERGFFQIYVPIAPTGPQVATIRFSKRGYRTEDRRNVALWRNGDWIYRIRLHRGKGLEVIDDGQHR